MESNPPHSVIMPLYNAERFVGESIGNILGQTVGDFRFRSLSTTPRRTPRTTSQAVMPRKTRIVLMRNDANHGAAYTRNRGLEPARGSFDRSWMPTTAVRRNVSPARQHSSDSTLGDLCGSYYTMFGPDDAREQKIQDPITHEGIRIQMLFGCRSQCRGHDAPRRPSCARASSSGDHGGRLPVLGGTFRAPCAWPTSEHLVLPQVGKPTFDQPVRPANPQRASYPAVCCAQPWHDATDEESRIYTQMNLRVGTLRRDELTTTAACKRLYRATPVGPTIRNCCANGVSLSSPAMFLSSWIVKSGNACCGSNSGDEKVSIIIVVQPRKTDRKCVLPRPCAGLYLPRSTKFWSSTGRRTVARSRRKGGAGHPNVHVYTKPNEAGPHAQLRHRPRGQGTSCISTQTITSNRMSRAPGGNHECGGSTCCFEIAGIDKTATTFLWAMGFPQVTAPTCSASRFPATRPVPADGIRLPLLAEMLDAWRSLRMTPIWHEDEEVHTRACCIMSHGGSIPPRPGLRYLQRSDSFMGNYKPQSQQTSYAMKA